LPAWFADIARLQSRDHAAALVAQAAPFIELVRIARSNKPAIAGEERQFGGEPTAETLDESAVFAEPPLLKIRHNNVIGLGALAAAEPLGATAA
jgi:hypothetical protein